MVANLDKICYNEKIMTYEQFPLFPEPETAAMATPEQASRAERLASIFENYGFYPESLEELTRATALQGFGHVSHPAVSHLGEVFIHQSKPTTETNDPAAAVRSVTRTMANYALGAKSNMHFAREAYRILLEAVPHTSNLTTLANITELVDRHIDGSSRQCGQIVRHHDLSTYDDRLAEGVEPLKLNYTAKHPDGVTKSRLDSVLGSLRLYQGIDLARATLEDQFNRYKYWRSQLEDATNHPYARAIAQETVEKLGLPDKRIS